VIICLVLWSERRTRKKFSPTFKARNGVAPSYAAELLRDCTPVRASRSLDFPTLAVPTLWNKLKTYGDRSFCESGPRVWNSLPPSFRAGALACTDATPGTVSTLLLCYLSASHFHDLSRDSSSLPATSVLRSMRKRADSPRGSVLALEKIPPPVQSAQSLWFYTLSYGEYHSSIHLTNFKFEHTVGDRFFCTTGPRNVDLSFTFSS